MSKINTLRIINLNYNNNSMKINDEIFHMNGESTLLSLRNGGGKTVLVQMLTAPFVHKRYRDTKDRPFSSYFTTNKPTFLLVEWALDGGAGYVLTGMMVRKNQEISEESAKDELEMIHFIYEYSENCDYDIHHIPVVENGENGIRLKGYGACKKMFEEFRKNNKKFFLYQMNQPAQSRLYFEKLKEYQINYKEWESIIKKVNLKESGLSELFSDCREEKGLVEKWFLDAVENKLNKDTNRVKEFQGILTKYVRQYLENQTKFSRIQAIENFLEESIKLRDQGENYLSYAQKKQNLEQKIVQFLDGLQQCIQQGNLEKAEQVELLGQCERELEQIEYEKLSYRIYQQEKDCEIEKKEKGLLEEKEKEEKEIVDILKRDYQKMECAKLFQRQTQDFADYKELESRLKVSRQSERQNETKRKEIGQKLYGYYQFRCEETEEKQQKNLERKNRALTEKEQLEKWMEEAAKKQKEEIHQLGKKQAQILAYDKVEDVFQKKYGMSLVRNILGEYPENDLQEEEKREKQKLEDINRTLEEGRKKRKECREKRQSIEREKEELNWKKQETALVLERLNTQKQTFDEELACRKEMLSLLSLPEEVLFDQHKILCFLEEKTREIEVIRNGLQREYDQMNQIVQRLEEGRVLELSSKVKKYFKDHEIPLIYGMEYLQKNGKTEEENLELVERQPFLPYSLILPKKELERLKKLEPEAYTQSPIPVIEREMLDHFMDGAGLAVQEIGQMHFYLHFQKEMLSKEGRQHLIQLQKEEMERKNRAIEIRREEYETYFSFEEKMKGQQVTKAVFEKNKSELEKEEKNRRALLLLEEEKKIEANQQEELERQLEKQQSESEKELQMSQLMWEDFQNLCESYQRYLEDRNALENIKKEEAARQEEISESKKKLAELQKEQESAEKEMLSQKEELRQIKEKQNLVHHFATEKKENYSEEEVIAFEKEYKALTSEISQEIQNLEESLNRALTRYLEDKKELEQRRKRFGFSEDMLAESTYSTEAMFSLEENIESHLEEKRKVGKQINQRESKIYVLQDKISQNMAKLRQFGHEQPMPAEFLNQLDFDERKILSQKKKEKVQQLLDRIFERLTFCQNQLDSMSEYENLPRQEGEEMLVLDNLSNQKIREYRGEMLSDYKKTISDEMLMREQLQQLLNELQRRPEFEDEFFAEALHNLAGITANAKDFLRQVEIVRESYQSMLEKLQIDLSMIEQERLRILELLLEYVKEIHENLGQIDRNSTIRVHGKDRKMLTLRLPEWETNAELYYTKVEDLLSEVTQKGLQCLKKNENLDEMMGVYINTCNLYDSVVGNGNVEIRLYKIEEQKEYQIHWSDVAKNSGGEGFLSAFIILTSLLYYMRRDDTDLFVEKNEGKVLVMDNPFAQTNAAHLLKPLMDLAKKTNTQLICLSGLGGDSIYSRFDNIYVLSLIQANLHQGSQYLQGEHLRGKEPDTMIASRFHVMEQQELIF